jgi:transposase-like protein
MKKYDEEFKRDAVRKVLDGQSVASVARGLGIRSDILRKSLCRQNRNRK